ncbi:MAG: hypothetical protein JO266_18255 [Acidobacteria bacterium]|nr:hypothetical protein [Acidobacteriota bacterium]
MLALVANSATAQKAPIAFGMPATMELLAAAFPGDWSTHYQFTGIYQGYPAFRAPYSGPNSLTPGNRSRETMTGTAYIGRALWDGGALYLNPEFAQGFGLSHTFGLAGFPNGEAQKSGSHVPKPYIARFYLTQTIGLGGEQEDVADDPISWPPNATSPGSQFTPARWRFPTGSTRTPMRMIPATIS